MIESRINALYECIEHEGLAGVAVNAGPSLTYLTGIQFHLMERPVVMVFQPGKEPTIILPELEQSKLEVLDSPLRIFAYGENPEGWQKVFDEALANLSGGKIGVEPRQLRLLEYTYLTKAINAEYVDGSRIIAVLRARKDADEITAMQRAVTIAEQALEATIPIIKIGVSEKDIAGELFLQLIRNGSDSSLPFSAIIAAGPNGANPHAQPSERLLCEGDLLIIDWGASYSGYVSDLTRTFCIGEIDQVAKTIYQAVQQANSAGRQAGKPGVACSAVDRAAREVITSAGYGEYFTHRTGHGLGMECHEDPFMHGDNDVLLEVGNTYTVEPGIYLPGRNGVRIEDDMVVTENGSESLSTMSREIRVLG